MKMYSCLPWELRDRIHTFCVQGPYDNEVIVRRSTSSKPTLLVRQSISAQSYQWIEDPILRFLNPRRIGLNTAREVLGAYYRTRVFKFAHQDLESLQVFLESDSFCLGMQPADHVRRVHLQIEPAFYTQLQSSTSKEEEITRCCRNLWALAAIRTLRTTVIVHIGLAQAFSDDEEHEQLVGDITEFVFRTVEAIEAVRLKGVRIQLVFEGGWDEKCGLKLCNEFASSLDDCKTQVEIACAQFLFEIC